MIILGIAACALVAALLYGSYVEGKRHDELIEELKQLRQHNATLKREQLTLDSKIKTHGEDLQRQDSKTESTFKAMKQNLDIMEVRQRTLEKKIVSSERTINLVFRGNVPIEQMPHIVNKEKRKRGAGRGALIPETV